MFLNLRIKFSAIISIPSLKASSKKPETFKTLNQKRDTSTFQYIHRKTWIAIGSWKAYLSPALNHPTGESIQTI